jgi:hypothetical protein
MSRVSRGFRRTGKAIKFLFFFVVFFVIALLLWRIFSSGDPKSMKSLTVNEKIVAAYEQEGKDLYMFRQTLNKTTYGKDNYGYFTITDCVFIPEANQVQLVLRYNNGTIQSLAEDYALEQMPARTDDLYDVTLVIATDLTPDITEDNAGNDAESVSFTRLHPTSVTSAEKNLYNYRRFVFDLDEIEMDLSELTGEGGLLLAMYADIYYVEDIRYDEYAYGTLCVYDYLQEKEMVKLGGADLRALRKETEE